MFSCVFFCFSNWPLGGKKTAVLFKPYRSFFFFRNRLQRRLNYQLFSPKVILPIFNPIFTTILSDRREEILSFYVIAECYAHVTQEKTMVRLPSVRIVGSKIGKIGNLAFVRRRFPKKCALRGSASYRKNKILFVKKCLFRELCKLSLSL